jgi:hypothetical protein
MTLQELENKINEAKGLTKEENNAKEQILGFIQMEREEPGHWEDASELMNTLYDEEHDGAYTEDEITHPFDEFDIDGLLYKAGISKKEIGQD